MRFQVTCAFQFLNKAEVVLDPAEVAPITPHFPLEASLQPGLLEQGWEHGIELQRARDCPSSAGSAGEKGRSRAEPGARVYFISVLICHTKPLQGFEWDTSCPYLRGDRLGLPQHLARLPSRASSAPHHSHPGESAALCPSAMRVPGGSCQPLFPGSPAGALLHVMCSSRNVAAWARTCSSLSCSSVLNGART